MMQYNDVCPVCGMEPNPSVPSVTHNKLCFRFCSEQCRETFIARPNLYLPKLTTEKREILKKRCVCLDEPVDDEVAVLLISYLKDMMGVKEVAVEGNKLSLTYDLLQVNATQIEKELMDVGIKLGGNWFERLCRGWLNETEEIELDNLSAPPAACCNRLPPRR